MQVMSPKPTLFLGNRGSSHILMGSIFHSSNVNFRGGFCLEMPRISIVAFAGGPTNIEPASSTESENILYCSEAIEQHTKALEDEITTTEKLFNCEETESAVASADVMGFAEEAQKALKSSTDLVDECKFFEDIRSEENWVICEQSRPTEKEKSEVMKALDQFRSQVFEEESSSNVACPHDSPSAFVSKHVAETIIESQKKTERRAKRVKARANIIRLAAAAPSCEQNWRPKRTTIGPVDFSDPEHVLRELTNSKPLTSRKEIELSKGIQDMLKLNRIRLRLVDKIGHEPTLERWAQAVGTDEKALQRRLRVGHYSREYLMRSRMGIVRLVAKQYRDLGLSGEELVQIGCLGLYKAIEKFDYRMGFRFAHYAYWWIRDSMVKAICYSSDIVRYPVRFYWKMYRVKQNKRWFKRLHARRPRLAELARITGLSVNTLILIRRNTGERRTFNDDDADPNAVNPEDVLIRQELKRDIAKSLAFVTPKEREVLRMRYGLDDGRSKPLREIGYLLNYTGEGIRVIEKRALRKVREISSHILKHYL